MFIRLEVLPKAVYYRRLREVRFYDAFFQRVIAWASPLDQVAELALEEARRCGLSGMDALHVAAATLLGADELVTTEGPTKPIHRTTSVKIVSI